MADLEGLLRRLEELLDEIEAMDEQVRGPVFELLDGFDTIHRLGLTRLADAVGMPVLDQARAADPAVAWLLHAYGIGVRDARVAAEEALAEIRPYIEGHGGTVEVLDVSQGRVRVRLSGSCAGCTASAVTLREGVQRALEERFPGFAGLDVEEELAPSHPPPGPTLLQIQPRPGPTSPSAH